MLSATLPIGHAARPDGDRYLTPRWGVRWFSRLWTPNVGTLIYDPSAGGHCGFTIGGFLASLHKRECYLADLNPLAEGIVTTDYLTAPHPSPGRALTVVTNPPYSDMIDLFLRKALSECGDDGEVILLIPYLWLMDTARVDLPEPTHIWQARKRYEFELTEPDYLKRIEAGGSGRKSAQSATGYSAGSPGGAHVWVRWTPRNDVGTMWIRRSVEKCDMVKDWTPTVNGQTTLF